jgi:polyisoprenoid-binding protein YceI
MTRFLPALSLLVLAACAPDVGEGHVTATVSPSPVAAAQAAQTQKVAIDTASSTLHAKAAKITATHDIVFEDWAGSLELAGDAIQGVQVSVQIAGMKADQDKLTAHLQSPDFFDAARFPTASFQSSSVTPKAGPEGATHVVTGTMSMHGVDKELSFPATLEGARLRTEFVIDRQDFGIAYPGMPDDLIQDDVLLTLDLRG